MAFLHHSSCSCLQLLASNFMAMKSHDMRTNPKFTHAFACFLVRVKSVANNPLGESRHRRLEEREKVEVVNASNFNKLSQQARMDSSWYGEKCPRWLGPIPYEYPAYLDGQRPGDYGFDVTGLSKDLVAF